MFHALNSDSKQQTDCVTAIPGLPKQSAPPTFDGSLALGITQDAQGSFATAPVFPRKKRMMRLQKACGNQVMQRMLKLSQPAIQRKLVVNEPGDTYEQEADRVADQLMRMPDADLSIASAPVTLRRKCASCEAEEKKELQTKRAGTLDAAGYEAPRIVHDVLRSLGQPLDTVSLSFFEPRFGHDFSQVRIHANDSAAASASAVGARAYTVGSHVVFARDEYSPSTRDGRRLMAHELAHVVQQSDSLGDGEHREIHVTSAAPAQSLMRQDAYESIDDSDLDLQKDQLAFNEGENQEDSNTYDDIDLNQSEVELASSQGAKSTRKRKPKPTPQPTDRIPTVSSPSAGALKALDNARMLHDQQDPAIWFDSWGNDLRDNNLNGTVDENAEQGIPDGAHYGKLFDAKICNSPSDSTDQCPLGGQSMIKVQYKVCIDIPIESYKAAGTNVSTSRWIPTFFGELSSKPNWTVWKKPAAPSQLLDGDIVAADNAEHQHAGMVDTGLIDFVINLPGPTSSRKFQLFNPSGKNDMISVPRFLFESYLGIEWVARLNR